ncbi:MAG: response regulator [Polyangiaceae bacterium]
MILYVEDNEDIRAAYSIFLRRSGFCVVEACDGLEGVERAIELVPDLVLMDMDLPTLDGYEATRRIKMDARTAHVPVIALSAHHDRTSGSREAMLLCDAFLAKPIDGAEVVRHVIECLANVHKGATTAEITKRTF